MGDVLGSLIDVEGKVVKFYLNGRLIVSSSIIFKASSSEFYVGASFMSFQQCRFNFGNTPFAHPPSDIEYRTFNDHATLEPSDRIVLPRHLQLEALRNMSIREDSCTICFDKKARVLLKPCLHDGFCKDCTLQLTECPMCRGPIVEFVEDGSGS